MHTIHASLEGAVLTLTGMQCKVINSVAFYSNTCAEMNVSIKRSTCIKEDDTQVQTRHMHAHSV